MQPHNRQRLEKYRRQYNAWVNDRVLYDLDGAAKNEIIDVIRQEWNPGYTTDLWCGSCVAKMLEYAFRSMDTEVVKIKMND